MKWLARFLRLGFLRLGYENAAQRELREMRRSIRKFQSSGLYHSCGVS